MTKMMLSMPGKEMRNEFKQIIL